MNPFKEVYDEALEHGESVYTAKERVKVLYADYVLLFISYGYSAEFTAGRLNNITQQLNEVLA
jgi:hypothetical protein